MKCMHLLRRPRKVQLLNQGKGSIADAEIERFLREQSEGICNLHFTATSNNEKLMKVSILP